jgi:hypothetical protein
MRFKSLSKIPIVLAYLTQVSFRTDEHIFGDKEEHVMRTRDKKALKFVFGLMFLVPAFILTSMPLQAVGEDRLIITDSLENVTFTVTEDGILSANKALMGEYATEANSNRAMNLISSEGGMKLWRVHDSFPPFIEFMCSKPASPTTVLSWWDMCAGKQYGSRMFFIRDRFGGDKIYFSIAQTGYVGFGLGTTAASYPIQMASGARCTAEGVWENASSREYKEDVREITAREAMETLEGLKPVEYRYKNGSDEKYVGFIAEDVPELVAAKDRKGMSSMDVVAVLTRVIQEQQKVITELREKLDSIDQKMKDLEE